MFHHLKLLRQAGLGAFGLKLDVNKAYDSVEWDFLHAVLLKLGFHSHWVMLIMNCVKTVSFSVLVNGKPSIFFNPTRGLRQGDPLSPYLFLFVSDVLSSLVRKACSVGWLSPVSISQNGPPISHLLFADDSLFFLEASVSNAYNLLYLLKAYGVASGQQINYSKSSLYFSPNTPIIVIRVIAALFGIVAVSNPGRYLGLPTIWGRSKCAALAYIRDTVSRKLQGWKQQILTQAGKEVLIKSIATAIPAYPMNCFRFPKSLCTQIASQIARFWWGNKGAHGIHWKSWLSLGFSKAQGGMGFRDLTEFNQALLAKQGWRILTNPSSVWVMMLKHRYFPSVSFMEARLGSSPSWLWASLLHGRELLKSDTLWRVGNGLHISVWDSNWIPHMQEHRLTPPPRADSTISVSSLIDWSSLSWDLTSIAGHISVDQSRAILAIPLVNSSVPDKLIWSLNKSGNYTVRSGYYAAHLKSSQMVLSPNSKLVANSAYEASSEFLRVVIKTKCPQASSLPSRPPPKPKWLPPPPNYIKINSDASWSSTEVGLAAIARNCDGVVVGGSHLSTSAPSPLYAEALALCLSVHLAQKLQADKFLFESDSLQLVNLLQHSSPSSDWVVMPLIDHIRDLTVAIRSYSWTWSSRLANQAADHVAWLARKKCPADWLLQPPSSLSHILLFDAVHAPT
ncbi:uncharacterized protein LOC133742658 [Rosa rugosa]|uniref:uncharacterized protein LOC133742658 n=1 Tax=Rosa rugosa TaxID=74645 RepID=UPI002B407C7D|nr:uncharacterized protein LOC133742658 [Rosa rugosa]